ncbi:MAG: hypothetical protein EG826_04115 [Deltaproteobacteria bacterium]|nr:hypothetical protein [Deltaproteobacteria bacterium]
MESSVPIRLELIPDEQKVIESLGLQPAIFGALLIIVALVFPFVDAHPRGDIENAVLLVLGMGGFGLLYYEMRRRLKKAVLVRAGDVIAFFHGKVLIQVYRPEEIKDHHMPLATFLTIFIPILLLAILFFMFALVDSLEPGYRMLNALCGLALLASSASFFWTRFLCEELLLPGRKRQFFLDSVLIRPFQRKILFGDEGRKGLIGFIVNRLL